MNLKHKCGGLEPFSLPSPYTHLEAVMRNYVNYPLQASPRSIWDTLTV